LTPSMVTSCPMMPIKFSIRRRCAFTLATQQVGVVLLVTNGAHGARGGPPRGPSRGGVAPSRSRDTSYSRDNPSHPQCQICGKIGHTTLKC
jgi:hypothetical protein